MKKALILAVLFVSISTISHAEAYDPVLSNKVADLEARITVLERAVAILMGDHTGRSTSDVKNYISLIDEKNDEIKEMEAVKICSKNIRNRKGGYTCLTEKSKKTKLDALKEERNDLQTEYAISINDLTQLPK